jgi:hypothetical protein
LKNKLNLFAMNNSDTFFEISANIVGILVYFAVAAFIAHYLGRKRQIGFWWSFIFNATASPIFGIIVTLLSKKTTEEPPKKSKAKIIIGWALSVIVGIVLLANIELIFQDVFMVLPAIAYFLLGIYLIGIGKGKVFNKKVLSDKTDNPSIDSILIPHKQRRNLKFFFKPKILITKRKIRITVYFIISALLGFMSGWLFKLPNSKLLLGLYTQESEWKKGLVLKLMKKSEPFFSTEYFSFNWVAFFTGTFLSFGILILFEYYNIWGFIAGLKQKKN